MKRHDSTPPGSWLREQYEKHRRMAHPVEDAFDPIYDNVGGFMRPLAELLSPPVSSYRPQMARELYGDDDGA